MARPHGSTKTKVTATQNLALNFIYSYLEKHGYCPSVREIGQRIGCTSPSTVQHHLDALQRKGFIKREKGMPRAIRILHFPQADDLEVVE